MDMHIWLEAWGSMACVCFYQSTWLKW
jgi:hypothetical protein